MCMPRPVSSRGACSIASPAHCLPHMEESNVGIIAYRPQRHQVSGHRRPWYSRSRALVCFRRSRRRQGSWRRPPRPARTRHRTSPVLVHLLFTLLRCSTAWAVKMGLVCSSAYMSFMMLTISQFVCLDVSLYSMFSSSDLTCTFPPL